MSVNPDPARITAASWWFMEQLLLLEPGTRSSGIYVDKPGYHNTRANLLAQGRTGDYSIQLVADKLGPDNKAAAYDWTFLSAQSGNYDRIMLYGRRIHTAFNVRDPRLHGWREALGQADPDLYAEGFDFAGWYTRTPDASHLWHWHFSELRQNLESYSNKQALLSVLRGQTFAEWIGQDMPKYLRVTDNGAIWCTNGPTRWTLKTLTQMNAALALWGQTVNDLVAVDGALLDAYGADVGAFDDDGDVLQLTDAQLAELKAELEDAAFRAAQRAEDE